MSYEEVYERLLRLKEKSGSITEKENIQELIQILSKHPDAIYMVENVFLNPKQVQIIKDNHFSAETVLNHIAEHFQIRTTNSLELTYKYYGYVRAITPEFLDHFIDEVATRVQLETEYAEIAGVEPYIEQQEEKTTMSELGQFC